MSGLPFANSSLNSLAESSTANTPVLPYANAPISPASTVDHDTSLDTVNTTVEYTPPNSLHCRSLNARSVMNKKEDIKVMLTSDHLDVLAITETFLCDVILDSELVDDDYVIFRRDRDRHGGGVMAFVHKDLLAIRRHDLESDCELLWIELLSRLHTKTLLGVFYRPPSASPSYLAKLEDSLASIPDSSTIILCGDFNAPHIDWSKPEPLLSSRVASDLCEITQDFALHQLVCDTTRGNNTLDLLLTNDPVRVHSTLVVDGLPGADHDAVDFKLLLCKIQPGRTRREVYDFKRATS